MSDWKADRIESALRGENPTVLTRMKSGFAVIGDTQFLPGYCVLIGYPKAKCLNDLNASMRKDFLYDMTLIGDAIASVCSPLKINYDILGNADIFLHAHIFPRYSWEVEERKCKPVWQYPRDRWTDLKYQFSVEEHGILKLQLTQRLQELIKDNY